MSNLLGNITFHFSLLKKRKKENNFPSDPTQIHKVNISINNLIHVTNIINILFCAVKFQKISF